MIKLWDKTPYFNEKFEQEEPALFPYPADGKKRGAVIVCAGGGYAYRAEHEGVPVCQWLSEIGVSGFNLTYRTEPYTYKATVSDVLRAIQVLRFNAEKFNVDPEKIGVLGFSAGGHLASCAATHFSDFEIAGEKDEISKVSARPDAAILCYPLITSEPSLTHSDSFVRLLGDEQNDEKLKEYFSTEKHVKNDTPPTFLWHTSEDSGVNVTNSLLFAAELRKKGIPFELHVFPHGRHGLGLNLKGEEKRVSEWKENCKNWFETINFI